MPRSKKPNKITSMQIRRRGRERLRGFFAFAELMPYRSRGVLLGQQTADFCFPACCRMLLFDIYPELQHDYSHSESFLRTALMTDQRGTSLVAVPQLLRHLGHPFPYRYRRDVRVDELRRAVQNAAAMVRVAGQDETDGHVILVEEVNDETVALRDPLPEMHGSAYRVSLNIFLTAWQGKKTGLGQAILVE